MVIVLLSYKTPRYREKVVGIQEKKKKKKEDTTVGY